MMVDESIPTLSEFMSWDPAQIEPLLRQKSVIFSPGGSSRWYFLEHGDLSVGYDPEHIFLEYAKLSLRRTIEIADVMFSDGLRTLFVIAVMPGQFMRSQTYSDNVARALGLMVDDEMKELYAEHEIGMVFRGAWAQDV